MNIKGFEYPDGLYYDAKHGWAKVEGGVAIQGMTEFGQKIAQEIVFVEAPRPGREVKQGDTFMSLESGKWVGRIPAMFSGTIEEVNEDLEFEPTLINEDPYEGGWMVKINISDLAEEGNLWTADSAALKAFIEEEAEKYAEFL